MGSELHISDPSFKEPILVSSIPAEPDTFSYGAGTMLANNQLNIVWTVTPFRPQLSLWNFSFTLRFGTDAAGYEWPNGANLTTNQSLVDVMFVTDALSSDDSANVRVNKIAVKNGSADVFNFYFYFKAYTFNTSVGSNA